MNNLTIFAVVKVKESKGEHLYFAETEEIADQLYSQAVKMYLAPGTVIRLVSFEVDKERLYDFIVGEDDYEKELFLVNALAKQYSLLKDSTG
ncbi:hypothetical protein [Adhaeribacter rhizoryzae]|uniref:Uncharacterized protein n=1 Tax=Adhaeribacter rhizoryzae TaxID=2607907 RepID=A0A5M6D386_9BACT|nr:hypothetical protein [Adhaeribacter rhizoryzae]KAA5541968.1 hypothetical protein F0145_19460 [Adhaeribacter rhizoryzae]